MKTRSVRNRWLALAVLLLVPPPPTRAEAPPARAETPPASFTVKVTGRGRPMILIPGLSSSGETWNGTVAHLQGRYACHVLTLAGFAGERPIEPPLLAKVRDDLAAYIQREKLDKPVVVGHSLGGTLALDLAARHPTVVGPLVIVDSLPFLAGAWFQAKTASEAAPMVNGIRAMMTSQTREQYEQFVRSGAATKAMVSRPEDLETLTRWGLASDSRTVAEAMAEMLGQDLRPDLSRITSPVLLIGTWVGVKEQAQLRGVQLTRDEVARTFEQQYAALPRMRFALADSARHFVMWDAPDWFFQQLDAFLADPAAAVKDRGFAAKP
jgi:pimeloyl-ACP methyl ester carboxylesterase